VKVVLYRTYLFMRFEAGRVIDIQRGLPQYASQGNEMKTWT